MKEPYSYFKLISENYSSELKITKDWLNFKTGKVLLCLNCIHVLSIRTIFLFQNIQLRNHSSELKITKAWLNFKTGKVFLCLNCIYWVSELLMYKCIYIFCMCVRDIEWFCLYFYNYWTGFFKLCWSCHIFFGDFINNFEENHLNVNNQFCHRYNHCN